jgi:hypothetical protein
MAAARLAVTITPVHEVLRARDRFAALSFFLFGLEVDPATIPSLFLSKA